MANGIKLRRGLKASLTPPVEGELTYATDTNELGLPDGKYINLDNLQSLLAVDKGTTVLSVRFSVNANELYDTSGENLW